MGVDHKQHEQTDARNYLKTIFNKIDAAIFVHDLEGKLVDVNERSLQMFNCTYEEAMSFAISEYWVPGTPLTDYQSVLWQKLMSGENQCLELKARRPKDGPVFDVGVFLSKLSLSDKDLILVVVHDITRYKRVEEELTATKNYLVTILNNMYDAVYIHDFDGRIIQVNDRMLQLHGAKGREEVIGLSIDDVSAPESPFDDLRKFWSKVIAGENQFFEWQGRRLTDGSLFSLEVYLTKLSLPNGDFVLANARDITERKKIENLLTKEKQMFFSVLEDNPHGIALIDSEERFVYINPEFTSITGYIIKDLTSWQDWVRKAYGDEESLEQALSRQRANRTIKKLRHDIICKDGQHKDVECRITYLEGRNLVVLTDTTSQKQAERNLRAEKQKFETFSESLPVGMVIVGGDDEMYLKYANPKFREIFAYNANDPIDLNKWIPLVYDKSGLPLQSMKGWTYVQENLKPEAAGPCVRKVKTKDGTQKYVKFIPIQLETGEILMTCEDVTLSKQAREKLTERNLELEVLNDIVSSVSHSLHLPEILDSVKRVFVEKLEISAGGIFFYDRLNKRLRMEMLWGVPDVMRTEFEAFALCCFTNGTPIDEDGVRFMRDQLGPSVDPFDGFQQQEWKCYLCMALFEEGEIQRMIFLADKDCGRFGDDHIAFYGAIAKQIGVATQNARLFEQVHQSQIEMKTLSQRLVNVQEAERRYVARELHDEMGRVLTGLNLALEMHTQELGREPTARLLEAKSTVCELVASLRELSLRLRPSMLDDLGLLPTLRWYLERFHNKTNIRVLFEHADVDNKRFAAEVETAAYRIVQEASTNVARHAKVNEVAVRVWCEDKAIKVQIEDHGVGFDSESILQAGSAGGLSGMKERALLLGGCFTIETQPGFGTRLIAELPTGDQDQERL